MSKLFGLDWKDYENERMILLYEVHDQIQQEEKRLRK